MLDSYGTFEVPVFAGESMNSDLRPIILAIDDDPVILNLTVGILRKAYRLRPFTSGRMAFKYLGLPGARVDLILLDHQMPDFDGPAVLEKLRDDLATRDIPVIFMTGLDRADDVEALKQKGAADYVSKPPTAGDLLEKIGRCLTRPQAG